MNVMIEQRGIRSTQVVRRLIIEVPDGPEPTPEQIERILFSVDEQYGPFRFSPVRHTEGMVVASTKVLGPTARHADVPLVRSEG